MDMSAGYTRLIIDTCKKHGLLRNQCAYVLATARHESAHTMQPVRETLATSDAQAIARLENAWKKGRLSWVSKPYWRDGYFGRGFVQLTHLYNYQKAARKLGVPLDWKPELALDAKVAADVLVIGMAEGWFTGKKLSDYVTLKKSRFVDARRIVNGTDRASAIAEIAGKYNAALKKEGYGVTSARKAPPTPPTPETDKSPSSGFLSAVLAFLKSILSFFKRS